MKIESKIVKRRYIITQKELKEKFGLVGDIREISLWWGFCENDGDEWAIITHESDE